MPRITGKFALVAFGVATFAALVPFATVAKAESKGADLSGAESCVASALTAGGNPADCLGQLHAPCLAFPQNATAQATLCFVETRKQWDARTKSRLQSLAEGPDPMIASVASIESRYELLTNLLQCDRLDELSALYGQDEDSRLLQKTRCEAAASGLTHIRLLVRSGEPG